MVLWPPTQRALPVETVEGFTILFPRFATRLQHQGIPQASFDVNILILMVSPMGIEPMTL